MSNPFSPSIITQRATPAPSFIPILLTLRLPLSSIAPAPALAPALAPTLSLSLTTNRMHLILFLPAPDVLQEGQRTVVSETELKLRKRVLSNIRNVVVVKDLDIRDAPVGSLLTWFDIQWHGCMFGVLLFDIQWSYYSLIYNRNSFNSSPFLRQEGYFDQYANLTG